jgi:hypothetical protein
MGAAIGAAAIMEAAVIGGATTKRAGARRLARAGDVCWRGGDWRSPGQIATREQRQTELSEIAGFDFLSNPASY